MDNGAQFYHLAEQKLQTSGLITQPPTQHQNRPGGVPDIKTWAHKHLEPKEFVWDRTVTLLVAGILSLTSVYLVVAFFRRPSSSVICHVPNNFTASQFAYVNSFCSSGLSLTQYYPIFITLQGLFITAPHQLWFWTFGGYTKYFVDLATTLDRLHKVRSGKHREANVAIVTKLEKEFSNKRIFLGYLGKLFVQLALTATAIAITFAVFDDFTVLFQCYRDTYMYSLHMEGYFPLDAGPVSFECLYTPLQFLSVLRYLNIILLVLVTVVLLFGIQWSFFGHPNELGAKKLAHFTFHLCLPASQVKLLFDGWFSPRIEDDLDFLLLQLYWVDAGYGQVFKELQIDKEFQYVNAKDHKLLQSFNDMQMDIQDYERKKHNCPDLLVNITDVKNEAEHLFKQAGFDEQLSSSSILPTKGTLRSELLKFVNYAPNKQGLVIDVSFGTTGFGRSLAWVFRQAVTICFHGLHNKQKPQKETFYTNHFSVNLPQENFSWTTSKASACLENELYGRNSDLCLIFVGPLDDQSKVTTVHVLINMLLKSKYLNIVNGAILLTVRPIRIGRTETAYQHFQYKPSKQVFGYLNVPGRKEEDPLVVQTETNNCVFEFCAYNRPAAFDLTVILPLNFNVIAVVGFTGRSPVASAEVRKHSENDTKCEELGWISVSLAVETYGAWDMEAQYIPSCLALTGFPSELTKPCPGWLRIWSSEHDTGQGQLQSYN
ncbi:hypothetical protein EMCRGX_G008793 [Ephydatia muelleri]